MSAFSFTQVKVLKSIPPIAVSDVVLGQYRGKKEGTDEEKQGYLDDPTVPAGQLIVVNVVYKFFHVVNAKLKLSSKIGSKCSRNVKVTIIIIFAKQGLNP